MLSQSSYIANAIRKGKYTRLKKIGLTKKYVNESIDEENLPITSISGNNFLESINNPTPLIYAILNEQIDTVLYLILKLHASLDCSLNGWYPIHFASAVYDHNVLCNIFKIEGTEDEITRVCNDGSSPLHIAVSSNNVENTLILLCEGADPNATNKMGNTPLHLCAKIGDMKIAECLISFGANVEFANNKGKTPLSVASKNGNKEMKLFFEDVLNGKYKSKSHSELIRKYIPELIEEEEEVSESEDNKENSSNETKKEQVMDQKEQQNSSIKDEIETGFVCEEQNDPINAHEEENEHLEEEQNDPIIECEENHKSNDYECKEEEDNVSSKDSHEMTHCNEQLQKIDDFEYKEELKENIPYKEEEVKNPEYKEEANECEEQQQEIIDIKDIERCKEEKDEHLINVCDNRFIKTDENIKEKEQNLFNCQNEISNEFISNEKDDFLFDKKLDKEDFLFGTDSKYNADTSYLFMNSPFNMDYGLSSFDSAIPKDNSFGRNEDILFDKLSNTEISDLSDCSELTKESEVDKQVHHCCCQCSNEEAELCECGRYYCMYCMQSKEHLLYHLQNLK